MRREQLPPLATVGLGMMVGAVGVAVISATGLIDFTVQSAAIRLAGQALPWWAAVAGMIMIATVLSYLTGLAAARRLGSRLASFVALTEVIFAVLAAWLLVGEWPSPIQGLGGALIVLGVVVVRWDELRGQHIGADRPATDEPPLSASAAAS